MKTTLSTTAILAAMSVASPAAAQGTGDWYVSVFGGYSTIGSIDADYPESKVEHEFDDSYLLGLAVGRKIGRNLRAEAELSYATYEGGDLIYSGNVEATYLTQGDASTTYLMGNLWYDLSSIGNGSYIPYVGGGLGVVSLDVNTFSGDEETTAGYRDTVTGLAAQIGFGVQIPVGAGAIDVGYRLKGAAELDIDNNNEEFEDFTDGTFTASNLQVGYTFSF
jgi:hypothetical protein